MTIVVAEISANHLGSPDRALRLVREANGSGAHAVKLQTWAPGKMVLDPTLTIENGPWAGECTADLYARALLPWEAQRECFALAREIGIECFSSVFDLESLAFLQSLGCPRYKIASFELVDLPLIRAVAATRKPLIFSTGMAHKHEIDDAVQTARRAGAQNITLLKCTSAYPADPGQANLGMMTAMGAAWNLPYGLSDHTNGIHVATVAAALGASMIEKHFTLAREDGGPDAAFSIEPDELYALVKAIAAVRNVIGTHTAYGPTEAEKPQLALRRSLHFACDLPEGAEIPASAVRTARPARGIAPRFLHDVVGGTTIRAVRAGEPVTWNNTRAKPKAALLKSRV